MSLRESEEQIAILRNAGFFQDGDDAYSLLAYIDSLLIEIEYLSSLESKGE